jgi:hypothetical protein
MFYHTNGAFNGSTILVEPAVRRKLMDGYCSNRRRRSVIASSPRSFSAAKLTWSEGRATERRRAVRTAQVVVDAYITPRPANKGRVDRQRTDERRRPIQLTVVREADVILMSVKLRRELYVCSQALKKTNDIIE